MESYLSFYDWLISRNITVPGFIRLLANVKTSTLAKAKINWLHVRKCHTILSESLLLYLKGVALRARWHTS